MTRPSMTQTRRLPAIVAAILAVAMMLGYAVGTAVAGPSSAPANNYDQQIAEANKQRAEQEKELKALAADLQHMEKEIVAAVVRLRELEAQLPGLRRELELAQERLDAAVRDQQIVAGKLEAAEVQDRAITARIAEDEARIEELRLILAELARESYRGSGSMAGLDVVIGATSTQDFVDQYSLQHSASRAQAHALDEMERIAAVNRNRGARQEAVREYIAELKVIADALVVEADLARRIAEEKKAEVDALVEKVRSTKVYLESKKQESLDRQRELERDQKKIEEELLELIRKKFESQNPGGNPTPIGIGHLAFPTAVPYITSSYGMRLHPVFGYQRLHAGTDFRAYCGTPIYASAGGRVEWAKWYGGFGNHVMIDHGIVNGNALHTSYAHLTSFSVSAGEFVTQGQLVGHSGTTGTSTACHLHFEVYVNGSTVNPMTLLGPIP